MALNAIALCSRALLKIGASPISGFEEGTPESIVASTLYPSLRDAMLSAHPWSFATRQAELPRLAEAPKADFTNAYQLPPDFLRALSAGDGGRGRGSDYQIRGRMLHTDRPSIVLTYIYRPTEVDFPAFFDHALIARMAAEFCLPLTENASRCEMLAKIAEEEFRKARLIDGQQDVPPAFEGFNLVGVRG